MGTPAAAAVSLKRLIDKGHDVVAAYTQPDRPAGRGKRLKAPPVKDLALEFGIPLLQPEKIRSAEALERFRSHAADVAVVVAYGRILPESFLHSFPMGAINVHFSLLPKYRGAAPVNWAIVNGEKITGVTTIQMDPGLDTGDILLSRKVRIKDDETAPELMARLAEVGAELLLETLDRYASITPVHQDSEGASWAPILKRDDGKIDWEHEARKIVDRIRGFQPFPGSFTFIDGKRVVFVCAKEVGESNVAATDLPGTVVAFQNGEAVVRAGKGTSLALSELQFEGKKQITAREAFNGGYLAVGSRFGEDSLV